MLACLKAEFRLLAHASVFLCLKRSGEFILAAADPFTLEISLTTKNAESERSFSVRKGLANAAARMRQPAAKRGAGTWAFSLERSYLRSPNGVKGFD